MLKFFSIAAVLLGIVTAASVHAQGGIYQPSSGTIECAITAHGDIAFCTR